MVADDGSMVTKIIRDEMRRRGNGAGSALARAVGVTPETVSKWKKGDTAPTPEKFPAIEEFFDIPTGTLRAAAGLAPEDDVPLMQRIDDLEAEMKVIRDLVADLLLRNEPGSGG